MQWAPSDRLSITGDAMFAQNDQESRSVSDLPFFVRQFEFVQFDDDPVVSLPDFPRRAARGRRRQRLHPGGQGAPVPQ